MPDSIVRVSRIREWILRRQLRAAVRLAERGVLETWEYDAIAIGTVSALQKKSPMGSQFSVLVFGIEAAEALRLDLAVHVTTGTTTGFGLLFAVPADLGVRFPGTSGGGDVFNATQLALTWGAGCEAIYRTALMRLRPWNRWMLAIDRWKGAQSRAFPNTHGGVWQLLGWIVAFLLGLMSGAHLSR